MQVVGVFVVGIIFHVVLQRLYTDTEDSEVDALPEKRRKLNTGEKSFHCQSFPPISTPPKTAMLAPSDCTYPSPQERANLSLQGDLGAVVDMCRRMGIDPDSNKGEPLFTSTVFHIQVVQCTCIPM